MDVALSRPLPQWRMPQTRRFLDPVTAAKWSSSCIKSHLSTAPFGTNPAQPLGRREGMRVTASKGT